MKRIGDGEALWVFLGPKNGESRAEAQRKRWVRGAARKSKMKRNQLLKYLKKHDAFMLREGSRHTIYQRGQNKTQIPRHNEIVDELARKICKDLRIPFVR